MTVPTFPAIAPLGAVAVAGYLVTRYGLLVAIVEAIRGLNSERRDR